MGPAFGLVEAKGLLPYFMDSATKGGELRLCMTLKLGVDLFPYHQMADKWSDIIENSESGYSAIIDVNMWFGKATLDAYVSVHVTPALGVRTLWANHDPISQKYRSWSFWLRLWGPRRCG